MKENEKTSLDQLFDDFDKKTAEQFKDILAKIDAINSELKKPLNREQSFLFASS
jgi:hypothetical protein